MDLLDLWLSIYCGYSILINGSPRGYIQATRGIRQGDPLSPFLFVIAMDYLSSLIEDAQNKGLIKGYISPNGLLHITHLLFSVDILLFFVNDKASLQNLRFIIKSFELASGLKINLHKFALAGINVDDASLQMAKNIWVCSISTLPIEYLGMPLGGSPKLEYLWNPIIERIDRKLHSWHHSYISKGGRLTLIQAVLSNLPTYYLSLFKAPVAVCKSIERKWRNFIWEGTDDKGRSHLVRWDIITSPKNKGGLSIDRVKLTNDALISKWIWRNRESTILCSGKLGTEQTSSSGFINGLVIYPLAYPSPNFTIYPLIHSYRLRKHGILSRINRIQNSGDPLWTEKFFAR